MEGGDGKEGMERKGKSDGKKEGGRKEKRKGVRKEGEETSKGSWKWRGRRFLARPLA